VFVVGGGVVILVSLFLLEILGMPFVGFGDRALVGPFQLVKLVLQFAANVTALTIVSSDWLVRGMREADLMAARNAKSERFREDGERLGDVAATLHPAKEATPV
jgi:hypothetical protein